MVTELRTERVAEFKGKGSLSTELNSVLTLWSLLGKPRIIVLG